MLATVVIWLLVVAIPAVFPIVTKIGIQPMYVDIAQTAVVGIGLFMPRSGSMRGLICPICRHGCPD